MFLYTIIYLNSAKTLIDAFILVLQWPESVLLLIPYDLYVFIHRPLSLNPSKQIVLYR